MTRCPLHLQASSPTEPLWAPHAARGRHKNGQSPSPSPAFSASRPWLCLPSRTSLFMICPKTSHPVLQVQPQSCLPAGASFALDPQVEFLSPLWCPAAHLCHCLVPPASIPGQHGAVFSAPRALGPRPQRCLPRPSVQQQASRRTAVAQHHGKVWGLQLGRPGFRSCLAINYCHLGQVA